METLLEDYKRRLNSIRELLAERDISEFPTSPVRLQQKEACYREFIVEIERAIDREEERKSITH